MAITLSSQHVIIEVTNRNYYQVKFVPNFIQSSLSYLQFLARRIVEDRCLTIAGSLTFTTLLALVPLFTVTITLTSTLPFTRDMVLQLKLFILKNFVPEMSGKMIGLYMDQFAQNATRLTAIGLTIVLGTAIALLFTIENSFNSIWRTNRRRAWWRRLRWAFILLTIGPLLIAASLSITMFFVRALRSLERTMPLLDDVLWSLFPILITTIVLYMAYRWIPNRHVPARHALLGAMLAAVIFELMKYGFVIYVTQMPTFSLVYGAFASMPIFLFWLFCCWLVVLLGAEVSATLSYIRHRDAQMNLLQRDDAIVRVQSALDAADAPLTFEQTRRAAPMPIDHAEDALDALVVGGKIIVLPGRPMRYAVCQPARFQDS